MSKDHLAIDGGEAVREALLPYGRQYIDEEDISAVIQTLKSGWITQGPQVDLFEKAVADYCGAKYGIAFCNGTAALHAACEVAGIGQDDEAITTPLTFAATSNAVVYCGGTPLFADIRPDTLNIDPGKVGELITEKTRAILPVDFAGNPADLDEIMSIAEKHGLVVIEDACHALGAEYKGRKVGSISHMTVFSFHPVKHITTAEGGMVVTNDEILAQKLKSLRHHGICAGNSKNPWRYSISSLGYNYRLSDIHCALGLSQLSKLDKFLRRRCEIAKFNREAFGGIEALELPSLNNNSNHAWHIFVVLLNLDKLSVDRDSVVRALRAENIGAAVHYPLVHLQPFYRETFGFREGTCRVAEATQPRLLTLPLFPAMTDGDVQDVVKAVTKVLEYYAR